VVTSVGYASNISVIVYLPSHACRVIRWALTVFSKSPAAYKAMKGQSEDQQWLQLPGERTLRRYRSEVLTHSGWYHDLLGQLQ
jgi:hypothetical protein